MRIYIDKFYLFVDHTLYPRVIWISILIGYTNYIHINAQLYIDIDLHD